MTALPPDIAVAVVEPVTAWLSSADASGWREPQPGPSASSQPEAQTESFSSRRAGAAPCRYDLQTYPWALRFRDWELERRFQIRRAAGESRLPLKDSMSATHAEQQQSPALAMAISIRCVRLCPGPLTKARLYCLRIYIVPHSTSASVPGLEAPCLSEVLLLSFLQLKRR